MCILHLFDWNAHISPIYLYLRYDIFQWLIAFKQNNCLKGFGPRLFILEKCLECYRQMVAFGNLSTAKEVPWLFHLTEVL